MNLFFSNDAGPEFVRLPAYGCRSEEKGSEGLESMRGVNFLHLGPGVAVDRDRIGMIVPWRHDADAFLLLFTVEDHEGEHSRSSS